MTFASLFVGYLQWDLCWIVAHLWCYGDLSALVHHAMFIGITHYVLWGWYFKQPYAWLSFTELSTPFLNFRWFLAVTNRRGSLYTSASLAFALTFLATRVLGYGLGILDLWRSYHIWQPAQWGLYVVIGGVHAGYALNLFWSTAVINGLARALKDKTK